MGAKPRHEYIAVECQMRGESVFSATDNRKFIPSIMLDSFSSSFLLSLIPATPSFDYRPTSSLRLRKPPSCLWCWKKRRLLMCLRKCAVKSVDLCLSCYSCSDLFRLLGNYTKLRVLRVFVNFQVRPRSSLSLGFVISEAFCSLRSDMARRRRCG